MDCPASNHTLSYVVGDDCTNSNDTYCEYDTHGFIELSYVDTSTYSVGVIFSMQQIHLVVLVTAKCLVWVVKY